MWEVNSYELWTKECKAIIAVMQPLKELQIEPENTNPATIALELITFPLPVEMFYYFSSVVIVMGAGQFSYLIYHLQCQNITNQEGKENGDKCALRRSWAMADVPPNS